MLVDELKTLLASSVALYIKAANFHWNVEGENFPQYHEFFGHFYSEVYSSIDTIAEYIRALDNYAPGSFKRFQELSLIADQVGPLSTREMFQVLYMDAEKMIEVLKDMFDVATEAREQAIANFLADRLDAFQKHCWMIRSILKGAEE